MSKEEVKGKIKNEEGKVREGLDKTMAIKVNRLEASTTSRREGPRRSRQCKKKSLTKLKPTIQRFNNERKLNFQEIGKLFCHMLR